ncbi:GntR family transcriptional regulator [Phytohabitans kaempferiae]|uniref:GntR family transcriptional regulator n=1 Tax=Phytohabitans kaempferiae TaxID=1620943 RepID=A0ABV6M3B4_9ACTN
MKPLHHHRSLRSDVLAALRNAIITGELAPGSLHSVNNLATQLGVSRTPVREALLGLAAQNMVRFERNRGIRILQTTAHDIEEIMSLRLLLEVPATYRAVGHLTDADLTRLRLLFTSMQKAAEAGDEQTMVARDREFHKFLIAGSGNQRLASFVDSLRDLVQSRGTTTAGHSRTLTDIVAEHLPILEMAEKRDAAGAARMMQEHLTHTTTLLLTQESPGLASLDHWPAWAFE